MSIQRWLNMPLRAARTVSPGDSVLVIAASQPPVPVAGKMKTSRRAFQDAAHAVARGMQDVREQRRPVVDRGHVAGARSASGMFVGPGMNTGFWKLMAVSFRVLGPTPSGHPVRAQFF
jgi:hypothetical protein